MTTDTAAEPLPTAYWRERQRDPDAIDEAREMGYVARRTLSDDAPEEGSGE